MSARTLRSLRSRARRPWDDPWKFYEPEAIALRQKRWAEEDARTAADEFQDDDVFEDDEAAMPYVRELPKIGRNDHCPCGSGKKYKKCCADKDRA